MPRPRLYDDKKNTSISVSATVLAKARDSGVNISDICEKALIAVVGNKHLKEIADKFADIPMLHKKKLDQYVGEDNRRAETWAKVTNDKFGTEFTKEDIIGYVKRTK